MKRVTPTLFCAAALVLGGTAVAGCGDSDDALPEDAVAKVGDTVITKSDFERAQRLTSDRTKPRDAAAKTRAMDAVLKAEWVRQEAEARNLSVTDAEVQKAVAQAKKSGFLSEANLKRAGLTLEQLLPTVRNGQLQTKVNAQLTERSRTVSAQDVADYYRDNKPELIVDERRGLRLVLTKTRAEAGAAKAALEDGQSWEAVAKRYSEHTASRDKGGKIPKVPEGKDQTGLQATVFRAEKGELTGPVNAEGSWAVFLVEKVESSRQATLEESRDEITQLLSTTRREKALEAFEKKYTAMTTCAPGYKVPGCKNGPKKKPAPSA